MQLQRPQLTQQQKLKLSPQLYQTVKILAMPIADLRTAVQEELEKNPALELSSLEVEKIPDMKGESADVDVFQETSDPGYISSGYKDEDSKIKFMEGALARQESLLDHLLNQLVLCKITPRQTEIGTILINNLDKYGFHIVHPESLFDPGEYKEALKVKEIIQKLDPVGTCTEDMMESLIVQSRLSEDAPPLTTEILEQSRDLLEKNRPALIAQRHNTTEEEVQRVLSFLKTLIPFPGSLYSSDDIQYVVPDLQVRREGEGVNIYLNDEVVPTLTVNKEFEDLAGGKDSGVNKYVRDQVYNAKSFIRSIEQRNSSMVKTMKAIIKYQPGFFQSGPGYIEPLTLKTIAEETDLHEGTVSRITSSKHVQTEWGIFSLKYFFSNAVKSSASGQNHSKESVKEIIRQIIIENSSQKKLSDQKISDILKEKGISVARRTVSKYRKELKILSSYDR